eukprot:gene9565-7778_t
MQALLTLSYEERATEGLGKDRLPSWAHERLRDGKHEVLKLPSELTNIITRPEHERDWGRLQRARDALACFEPAAALPLPSWALQRTINLRKQFDNVDKAMKEVLVAWAIVMMDGKAQEWHEKRKAWMPARDAVELARWYIAGLEIGKQPLAAGLCKVVHNVQCSELPDVLLHDDQPPFFLRWSPDMFAAHCPGLGDQGDNRASTESTESCVCPSHFDYGPASNAARLRKGCDQAPAPITNSGHRLRSVTGNYPPQVLGCEPPWLLRAGVATRLCTRARQPGTDKLDGHWHYRRPQPRHPSNVHEKHLADREWAGAAQRHLCPRDAESAAADASLPPAPGAAFKFCDEANLARQRAWAHDKARLSRVVRGKFGRGNLPPKWQNAPGVPSDVIRRVGALRDRALSSATLHSQRRLAEDG